MAAAVTAATMTTATAENGFLSVGVFMYMLRAYILISLERRSSEKLEETEPEKQSAWNNKHNSGGIDDLMEQKKKWNQQS